MSLFKYLPPERIDVLQNLKIRFSQRLALNDPFEMNPYFENLAPDEIMREIFNFGGDETKNAGFSIGYDIVQQVFEQFKAALPDRIEEIEEVQKDIPNREDFIAQVKEDYPRFIDEELIPLQREQMPALRNVVFEKFNENVGVLSLSETRSSVLMWAHYAGDHRGFIIEFDSEHIFFNNPENEGGSIGILLQVEYVEERPQKNNLFDLDLKDVFLTKSADWAYEKEWRIFKSLTDENLLKDNQGVGLLDASGQTIHLFSFPPEVIRSIICGCRMSEENLNRIRAALASDTLRHVELFRVVQDERGYSLDNLAKDIQ